MDRFTQTNLSIGEKTLPIGQNFPEEVLRRLLIDLSVLQISGIGSPSFMAGTTHSPCSEGMATPKDEEPSMISPIEMPLICSTLN